MITSRVNVASLKDANRLQLLAALSVNLIVFILVVKTDSILAAGAAALGRDWQSILPAGLGLLVAGLAAEQLTPHWKARLVFWRWRDPLPGCEAFTRWIRADSRIDAGALERKFGPFPTAPAEQNARWYGMYQSVADHPAVPTRTGCSFSGGITRRLLL